MSSVTKSERILEKVGGRLGLTEEGKEWLIAAIDPYHDGPIECCGYPDTSEAASVVQVVKCSTTLTAPDTTHNWDCNIFQYPWLTQQQYDGSGHVVATYPPPITGAIRPAGYGNNWMTDGAPSNNNCWSDLCYNSQISGTDTYNVPVSGVSGCPFAGQIAPYLDGDFRIIGMGFEVVNTTSELYIGGLVTTYRNPATNPIDAKTGMLFDVNNTSGITPVYTFVFADFNVASAPPANVSQALLLEGSKQWKAKEGCYVVPTLNTDVIGTGAINNVNMMYLGTENRGQHSLNGILENYLMVGAPAYAPGLLIPFPPTGQPTQSLALGTGARVHNTHFNGAGAYFSGLTPQTTLQLNATYIIERFPTYEDSALVVLAKPSPRSDRVALDMYSEIIRSMPTGVPQRMNGLGEWFADAVSKVSDFVAPVLAAIPLPGTQIASRALTAAGEGAKKYSTPSGNGNVYSPNGDTTIARTKVHVIKPKKSVVGTMKKKKTVKKTPKK